MRKVLVLLGIVVAMVFVFAGCGEVEENVDVADLVYTDGITVGDLNDWDYPSGIYFDESGQMTTISMSESSETLAIDVVDFYLVVDNGVLYLRSANQYTYSDGESPTHVTAFSPLTGDVDEVPSYETYTNQVQIDTGSYVAAYLNNDHYVKIHVVSVIDTTDSQGNDVKRATLEAWYNLDEGSTNFYTGEEDNDTSDEENETGE